MCRRCVILFETAGRWCVLYILYGSWIVLMSQKTVLFRENRKYRRGRALLTGWGVSLLSLWTRCLLYNVGHCTQTLHLDAFILRCVWSQDWGREICSCSVRTAVVKLVMCICTFDIVHSVRYANDQLHSPTTARSKSHILLHVSTPRSRYM